MLKEKQYRGKHSKYPQVQADYSPDDKLAIFVTTWGEQGAADVAISSVKDYYLSARTDEEVTSPFPLLPNLSLPANHLRIALMLANNSIFNEFNKDEYSVGVEIMAICLHNKELNVARVGGPNLICENQDKKIIPYILSHHLAHEFSASKNYPLPKFFLGTNLKVDVHIESFRHDKKNIYHLIMSDHLPQIKPTESIDQIEAKLKQNPDAPYWLGNLVY